MKFYSPQSSTFEAIKLNGIELIDNPLLTNQLFRVYEEFTVKHKRREGIIEHIRNNYYNIWLTKNLVQDSITSWQARDYNSILNDYEFSGNLNFLITRQGDVARTAGDLSFEILILKKQIEREIIRLKKGSNLPDPPQEQLVRFTLEGHEDAKKVILTGNFVTWDTEKYHMEYKDGKWEIEIKLKSEHYYLYKFIVDGKWIQDPENSSGYPSPGGGFNSLKYVPFE